MSIFSVATSEKLIREGDLVILYMSPEDLTSVTMTMAGVFHNRLGRFLHDDLMGKPFGSCWISDTDKYIWALRPTAELWTRALPHRTQILYHPDISFISEMLEMRPGSVVVESGTGSGSFSHSIARVIGATGHLHTFEFHPVRADKAREEFATHGIAPIVTVYHQDVCKEGFAGLQGIADAVFLDLPAPWDAIRHAKATLKVQKTCVALRENGFEEIEMYETLVREHSVTRSDFKQDSVLRSRAQQPEQGNGEDRKAINENNPSGMLVSRPVEEMRGHTSYLTFASLLPEHPTPYR